MDTDLDLRARQAGWPVLASYGMSECSSTVAVRDVLLSHVEARSDPEGRIFLRSPALLTGYVTAGGLVDPKRDGWFTTEDVGSVEGRTLQIRGRRGEFIKIGGESVDLSRLDRLLAELIQGSRFDAALVAMPDPRLGLVIHLAATGDSAALVQEYNARVLPFERIRAAHEVASIPRTALGKLQRAELLLRLSQE